MRQQREWSVPIKPSRYVVRWYVEADQWMSHHAQMTVGRQRGEVGVLGAYRRGYRAVRGDNFRHLPNLGIQNKEIAFESREDAERLVVALGEGERAHRLRFSISSRPPAGSPIRYPSANETTVASRSALMTSKPISCILGV